MKVAVVGGGAIGASIAWRLARRGADVLVLDDGAREGAATAAAGGMLAPLAEAHRPGPFLEFGLESLRRWPGFAAELEADGGLGIGYARAGKLVVALTAGEEDDLAATFAWQSDAHGARLEWLNGARARALEPALAPHVRAAVWIRDDHRVDNVELGRAAERAARNAGAGWLAQRVVRLHAEGGRVSALETADGGRHACDVAVLAAGAWSGGIEGLPRHLPVRPVRGQMLALKPARPLFGRTLAGSHGYLVPRFDGRVVIGSTMEEAGFSAATTPEGLAALREGAVRLVPGLADAARVGAWAGLRPATPDGLPILGPDPALAGLVYATGHFRNGILLTPVTADAISALVLGADDVDVAAYAPDRFVAAGAAATSEAACDLCGATMYEVHCKLVCPACGYKRDCSDLW